MNMKELQIKLQSLESFESPSAELEQYRTPPELASSVLWNIYMKGEFKGSKVYDLGCGTGTLGIGAKLLGAGEVVCVDIDEKVIRVARENADKVDVDITFKNKDVRGVDGEGDLVIQNPPFGSQKRGSDRPFIEKSLEIAPLVYSFHMSKTDDFVRKYVRKCGGKVTLSKELVFPLKRTMPWHEEEKENVKVRFYRFERR
ncbi:MAG: METTL5 family protein [Candidatus Aenigmatarchaeota archaeon]